MGRKATGLHEIAGLPNDLVIEPVALCCGFFIWDGLGVGRKGVNKDVCRLADILLKHPVLPLRHRTKEVTCQKESDA